MGHAAGDHQGFGIVPLQKHIHLGTRVLISVGKQPLLNDQLRILAHLALGVALGVIHTTDLLPVQGHGGSLLQIDDGLRIQNPFAGTNPLSVVLFRIGNLGVLAYVEGVNTVVLAVIAATSC